MPYKRVSANSASVAFWILLSRLFDSFCGGCIKLRILPPQKEAKIGQNNPQKRRSLISTTVSYKMRPQDFKFPFTWEERKPVIVDRVLFVPKYYEDHRNWPMPAWEDPQIFGKKAPV